MAQEEVAALQPCITDLRRIQDTEYNESFWLETLAKEGAPTSPEKNIIILIITTYYFYPIRRRL